MLLYAGADPNFAHRKAFNQNPVAICQCLYHAIIKHNVEIEYAQLLYNFGANLYCRDEKGRLPCECDQNKECKQYIKSFYGEFVKRHFQDKTFNSQNTFWILWTMQCRRETQLFPHHATPLWSNLSYYEAVKCGAGSHFIV